MKFALMAGLLALAGAAQAASIYSNGPVVGSNGLSVLTSPNSTYGWNVNAGLGYSAADDFTVPFDNLKFGQPAFQLVRRQPHGKPDGLERVQVFNRRAADAK